MLVIICVFEFLSKKESDNIIFQSENKVKISKFTT